MVSRKETTQELNKHIENEWSIYWFETIILPYIKSDNTTLYWIEITKNPNTTLELIETYIHYPWNWELICYSLITKFDFVEKYLHTNKIEWAALSLNKNITIDDIERNIELPWNWKNISTRLDITIEFIKKHSDKKWCIFNLSQNPSLWDDINKNAQNYDALTALFNPNVTLEFIERHMPIYTMPENEHYLNQELPRLPVITLDFIRKHKDVFNTECFSLNPNVTFDFIMENKDMRWSMVMFLELNPNVTSQLIIDRMDEMVMISSMGEDSFKHYFEFYKPYYVKKYVSEELIRIVSKRLNFIPMDCWDWNSYSTNETFSFDNVPVDKLSELNWKHLSLTKIKTVDDINKYYEYIDWKNLSKSGNITMDIIENNFQDKWCDDYVIMNPNLNVKMFKKNIKIGNVINKRFLDDKYEFILKLL